MEDMVPVFHPTVLEAVFMVLATPLFPPSLLDSVDTVMVVIPPYLMDPVQDTPSQPLPSLMAPLDTL
jgi:hypothetical protein